MRLLIVEDDQELALSLKGQLDQVGFAVDIAPDARDAEYLMTQFDYELIVLDLGLPDREGLDLLQHWRKKKLSVPVLILTGRDAWYEKVDGLKAGADDYMGKPFHFEELNARIHALIRRAHHEDSQVIRRGPLELDENTQALLLHGKTIALTGSEYRLLRYLMLHPGHVLSKERLKEQLYDIDQDIASNVVEVYIRRLRQKLGSDFIHNRRGQGYLFQVET